jgi:hypothetical protein
MPWAFSITPFALPLMMPGVRSLLACVAIFGGLVGGFFIFHPSDERGSPGEAIGALLLLLACFGFVVGAISKALSFRFRDGSAAAVACLLVGFVIVQLPTAYMAYAIYRA